MRHVITVLGVIGISAALMASPVRALEPDQLPPSYTLGLSAGTAHMGFADGAGGVLGNRATGSTLGVDTIPTFDSYFYVIEGLPNAIKTIHLGGTAYHVQNEALLQWFAGQTPSTAINGAYSYPDPVLTTPSVSRNPGCK